MIHRPMLTAALLAGWICLPAHAEEMTGHDHSGATTETMTGPTTEPATGMTAPDGDAGPSSRAFAAANSRMHETMRLALTGDADADFVRSMIPHHQGAIDMARIVLEYGKDPAIRTLAEAVIAAQQAEIAEMQAWLAANGK